MWSLYDISNEKVKDKIRQCIGEYKDLVSIVRGRKLKWFGHISLKYCLTHTIMHGATQGTRRPGRQKKSWLQNIKDWTGQTLTIATLAAQNREGWRATVSTSIKSAPRRSLRSRDSEVK